MISLGDLNGSSKTRLDELGIDVMSAKLENMSGNFPIDPSKVDGFEVPINAAIKSSNLSMLIGDSAAMRFQRSAIVKRRWRWKSVTSLMSITYGSTTSKSVI